mmetsp:Transcript_13470/g.27524  ORF Transcript_13470/g.27524 Transcript_13470/m.27524 type:complete len:192 (+) Transcript_13470:166-741(+)
MDLFNSARPFHRVSVLIETLPERHSTMCILLLFLPIAVGMAVAAFTAQAVDSWYRHIRRPWFTPPNHAFGPMWTIAYLCMGYASFLVYRAVRDAGESPAPLAVYAVQLLLNWLWSLIFFNIRNMPLAVAEVILLWFATLATAWTFGRVEPLAQWLMLPALFIVTLAVAITVAIMRTNPTPVEVVSASRKSS